MSPWPPESDHPSTRRWTWRASRRPCARSSRRSARTPTATVSCDTPERVARLYAEVCVRPPRGPGRAPHRHLRVEPRRDGHGPRHPALQPLRAPPDPVQREGARRLHPRARTAASPACRRSPGWSTATPGDRRCRSSSPCRSPTPWSARSSPAGVMVVIEAEHLCMSMRGVAEGRVDHGHLGGAGPVPRERRHPPGGDAVRHRAGLTPKAPRRRRSAATERVRDSAS